jgi:probable rRNA maturation factor
MPVHLRVHVRRFVVRHAPLIGLLERILSVIGEAGSELSVELVGNVRIRRLNCSYRKKDRITDVLAFPIREATMPRGVHGPSVMLGDVVVSVPVAVHQAKEAGRSVEEELAALLVHGVLHLCGYDHERSAREAMRMSRQERTVLNKIGPVPRLVTVRLERPKKKR